MRKKVRKNAAKNSMLYALRLKAKQGHGNSKHAAKIKYGGVSPYIHSTQSYRSYVQQVGRYGDWLAANHPYTTIDDAASYVQEYINFLNSNGKSAWTQKLAVSAIAKALGVDGASLATTDKRHARDIKRGRTETAHAAAAEKQYADDLAICECTGVRHYKEAPQVTPSACHWVDGHIVSISLVGKGGRPRDAIVLEGRGRDMLEARCKAACTVDTRLLSDMSGCNVHGARANYAARCYELALSMGLGNGQMYHPRDMQGRVFDKGALDYVNAQLGHGAGRYYTAVHNYLSYGQV